MGRKFYYVWLISLLILGPVAVWLGGSRPPRLLPLQPEPPQFKTSTVSLPLNQSVYRFTVSGRIRLNNDNDFARIILVDKQGREYLVYETYSAITDEPELTLTNACEETCRLNAITPDHYRLESGQADITISTTGHSRKPVKAADSRAAAAKMKIRRLNQLNRLRHRRWQAGETSLSRLTYAQKKKLFGLPILPNLQGFEFYQTGVFEVKPAIPATADKGGPSPSPTPPSPSPSPSPSPPPFVSRWDWRDIHGLNWLTPVRNQLSCGSCWAFAAVGAAEAQLNLYYNQPLNLDLAEQESVCYHPGSCTNGGYSGDTFYELETQGLVTEDCYPYSGTETCPGRCDDWQDRLWKITQRGRIDWPYTDETLKHRLVTQGPFTFGIASWWHVMTLAGYEPDPAGGGTVWILKNSWGPNWGESGYGRIIVPESERYHFYFGSQPYPVNAPPPPVNCVDRDQDSWCSWGISAAKPAACPALCRPEPDCNDANPVLGPFGPDYSCQLINSSPPPPPAPEEKLCRYCISKPRPVCFSLPCRK